MPRHDWISFLSDYGHDDVYVGVCHGVIARTAPHARVIDVCHTVPPGSVAAGARLLAKAAPSLPPGVVLAVVDPGVGTARRPIAVLAGDSVFVGPDNGLLLPAAEAIGGARAAFALAGPEPVSATFHGRDVFAPVAAQLSAGLEPTMLGPAIPLDSLVRLPAPKVKVTNEAITGEVALIDSFGNLQTTVVGGNASAMPVGARVMLFFGGRRRVAFVGRTFADVPKGKLVLYVDSAGYLAIACNGGNAAQKVAVSIGTEVTIRR